ncbi:MAG: dTDP-4-dehydrorhamnose 3,5-epimerase, partial [Pseudomonadota bacterium]
MHATPTKIADVLIIEPKVFGDARGFFYESFNQQKFNQLLGYEVNFVQDNHSRSVKNV